MYEPFDQSLFLPMTSLQIVDFRQISDKTLYEKLKQARPDKWLVADGYHCGVWWKNTPQSNENLGIIGQFHAENEEDSSYLLNSACQYLKSRGCHAAIGPMDGNTWKPYRFVTWSDGSSPFLMEPQNPAEWPLYWQQAGFSPYHEYISTRVTDLNHADPRLSKAKKRLHSFGITWHPIDIAKFADELHLVYQLSSDAFSDNIFYTPIDEPTFLQQYLPFADKVIPEYVLIAKDSNDQCCGFIFAIPDLSQPRYGKNVDRLIIKTLAVSSGHRSGGLGAILVDEVQKRALQNGLSSAIHALMYSKNNSTNIGKNSTLLRRYTLYRKELT